MKPGSTIQLKAMLDAADPSGQRPLFVFGRSGGYNYFLGRPNPTPLTHGFHISNARSDEVIASLRMTAPLLVDRGGGAIRRVESPTGRPFLTRWEAPLVTVTSSAKTGRSSIRSPGLRHAGPGAAQEKALYTVYDCGPGAKAQVIRRTNDPVADAQRQRARPEPEPDELRTMTLLQRQQGRHVKGVLAEPTDRVTEPLRRDEMPVAIVPGRK